MEWWNVLITVLGAALGALATWLLQTYSHVWAQRAILFVDDVIIRTVLAVNQTWVDEKKLAETTGDYVFDEAEQAIAKKKCKDLVWAQVTTKIKNHLLAWFSGDEAKLDAYIDTGIEAAVKAAKEGNL